MVDPLGLSTIGVVALSEGIKFLYGQAGELLKRWRDRAGAQGEAPTDQITIELPPAVFAGELTVATVDYSRLDQLAQPIRELWSGLAAYAQGIDEINPSDADLLERVDALRRALEVVIGQRMTFRGEAAPPSGIAVTGEAEVAEVLGRAAGVRARQVRAGTVRGRVVADRVEPGGEASGVHIEDGIGPS